MNWYTRLVEAAVKSLGPYRGLKAGDRVTLPSRSDFGVGQVLKTRMEMDPETNRYIYKVDVDFGFSTYGLGYPCDPSELVKMPKGTPVAQKKTLDPNRERLWQEREVA